MTTTFTETESLVATCRDLLTQLPSVCAFSHLTAARLHGLPLSYAMEEDLRTHVLRPISCSRVKRPGVVGHRALHPREIAVVAGLPVVGLADTWADLGELIGRGRPVGLDDAIVFGDAVATQLGTADPLLASLLRRIRPRGKNALLEAWDLVRVGSASPRETLSRLMFVRSGLPEPVPNVPIYAGDDPDRLLGVVDILPALKDRDSNDYTTREGEQG